MVSQAQEQSRFSRLVSSFTIPFFAVTGVIVLASCLPSEPAKSSPAVPTTLPDKFIQGTQTQQAHLLTPSPGPGTLKPPVPTIVPQATAFLPDPSDTPLGAGALFTGSGPFSSQSFYLESQWYEDVDAGNRRIFVGVGSIGLAGASKPTDQGVVFVAEAKWINGNVIFLEGAKGEYPTAQAAGSLHITDASGARLVLESSNGTTFYFDVPSRQFVDSLNATPPPTVTEPPDPTSIPTSAPPSPNASATLDIGSLQTQSAASTYIAFKQNDYMTYQAQPSKAPVTPNLAPTGIYDSPQFKARLSKVGFAVTNAWVEYGSGYDVIIYAGANVADGSSGVDVQWQLPDRLFEKVFSPTISDGALTITGWQNERLSLVSEHGSAYYFDIPAMQFVSSLAEVVPTATPLPTYSPTPIFATPDFSTPTLASPSTSVPTGYP